MKQKLPHMNAHIVETASKSLEQIIQNTRIHSRGGFQMRDPFLAGVLSFLIPGAGQIYNGRILIGIIWLFVTGVSWIGSAGTPRGGGFFVFGLVGHFFAEGYSFRGFGTGSKKFLA